MRPAYAPETIFGLSDIPRLGQLDWFQTQNAATAEWRQLFRTGAEEVEVMMMHEPIGVKQAYGLFGLLLGLLPPAAIFIRLFGYGVAGTGKHDWLTGSGMVFLCLMMNVVCCLTGYLMGKGLGSMAFRVERQSWSHTVLALPMLGTLWGLVAGGVGGFFFFGVGAVIGPIFAVPVGLAAFLVFGVIHRLMERGGMIDLRHFLPLATGIVAAISVLIVAR